MTSVETIFSIGLGLGLRGLINLVAGSNTTLSGILIGLWEGAVLHHLAHASRSLDPYVSYALRVVIDYFWTDDAQRLVVILLWTGLGMLLADVWPALSYVVLRIVYRCYREARRAIYSLDYLVSTASTIPSRVRYYAESSASSTTGSSVSVRRQPRRITSQPVPGAYTETSTVTDYQESEYGGGSPAHFRQWEVPPGGENEILLTPLDNDSERGSTVSAAPTRSQAPPVHERTHDYVYEAMSPTKSARPEYRLRDEHDTASQAAPSIRRAPSAAARSVAAKSERAPSVAARSVREPSVVAPSVKEPSRYAPSVKEPSIAASSVKEPSEIGPSVREPSIVAPSVKEPSVVAPSIREPSIRAPSVFAPSVATPSIVAPSSVPASSNPWKAQSVASRGTAPQMPRSPAFSIAPKQVPQPQPRWQSQPEEQEPESRVASPDPLDPLQTPPMTYQLPPMHGVFSDEDLSSPPEGPPPPFSFGAGGDALGLGLQGFQGGEEHRSEVTKGDEGEKEKGDDAAWEMMNAPGEGEGEEGGETVPPSATEAPAAPGEEEGKKKDEEEEEEDFGIAKKKKKGSRKNKRGGKQGG